jgi:hypothetical protein
MRLPKGDAFGVSGSVPQQGVVLRFVGSESRELVSGVFGFMCDGDFCVIASVPQFHSSTV